MGAGVDRGGGGVSFGIGGVGGNEGGNRGGESDSDPVSAVSDEDADIENNNEYRGSLGVVLRGPGNARRGQPAEVEAHVANHMYGSLTVSTLPLPSGC